MDPSSTLFTAILSGWAAGKFLAQTSNIPEWAAPYLGPLGSLVCMIVAVTYLAFEKKAANAKEEKRQAVRDEQLASVIKLAESSNNVISKNSEVLVKVEDLISK